MTLNHGLYPTEDDILEWHDTVVATNTMDREAFAATYEFSWAIQTFHCLALLQIIAIAIHKRYDVRYRDFYEAVIDASKQNPDTVIGKERKRLNEFLDAAISGQGLWHVSIPGFDPNVNWPMEEVSFLNIVQNKEHFYTEFLDLLVGPISKSLDIELDLGFAKELVDYQAALQVSPFGKPEDSLQLNNNLPAMLAERTTTWEDCEGQSVNVRIMAGIECDGDLERFAREVVWYGRKGGKFLARVEADVTVKKATA